MSNLTRDIGTADLKIEELVKLLREDKYLIPTFQRDFVWNPASIKKLWDSMFRFYPIGSLLYWETDAFLHTHRKLGGFQFPYDEDTIRQFKEWKYILDGQQRATSILVCMLGGTGRVQDNEAFDYTLYFDATSGDFFFADELDKRKGAVANEKFLFRVRDVPGWNVSFYRDIAAEPGYDGDIEHNIEQIERMFKDYKLSVVYIKGVEVSEVCEIFERINQEGKKLHPVDIIVARTYEIPNTEKKDPGFYLRDNLSSLKEKLVGSRWQEMDDLLVIQMVAICLRKDHREGRNPFGITPSALDNLRAAHFKQRWGDCERTILDTVKFLGDLKIAGPGILPFVYLTLPLCYHFHGNSSPNRDIARQWFWRNAFGMESFNSSTDVYSFCEDFFAKVEAGQDVAITPLVINRTELIQSSYYYRNARSRAVLAFLGYQNPVDFADADAEVLDNVYLLMSQAPNLHHIYPQNFLDKQEGLPDEADTNSLMNICYLRARTNIKISDRNPLDYFDDFRGVRHFDHILESHMISEEFLKKRDFQPADYWDFLVARSSAFASRLQTALPDVDVEISRQTR